MSSSVSTLSEVELARLMAKLQPLIEASQPDEVMVTTSIYDH